MQSIHAHITSDTTLDLSTIAHKLNRFGIRHWYYEAWKKGRPLWQANIEDAFEEVARLLTQKIETGEEMRKVTTGSLKSTWVVVFEKDTNLYAYARLRDTYLAYRLAGDKKKNPAPPIAIERLEGVAQKKRLKSDVEAKLIFLMVLCGHAHGAQEDIFRQAYQRGIKEEIVGPSFLFIGEQINTPGKPDHTQWQGQIVKPTLSSQDSDVLTHVFQRQLQLLSFYRNAFG